MADLFKYVQAQPFSLAGAGAITGDVTLTLKSFKTIDGVNLAMTDFGSVGFGTLEPGNGTLEEQISFTGVTQNANGTATLTGVKTVLFLSPYTATTGLAKTHAGSTVFVISNTSGFYNNLASKTDDETISGVWTFSTSPVVPTPTTATQAVNKSYVDVCKVGSITSASSLAPDVDTYTMYIITAQAATMTFGNPTGTPTVGQVLIIRIKDSGSAQALYWGTQYREIGFALPSTTVGGKTLYMAFIYNATDTKWDFVGTAQQS